ncbi:hypothetical protein SERLADRAFT_407308 [Serpula lacrymans var. lacrymans S7.9]|uniref:Uncharacterized protein n=1 Tax=Serpula lacrymans var. lacrymans (strain S7.9) TaxID=578457 RepID=F8NQB1_SERL9|nr:uncharacterized protein SERLADRAFT_407308 [Serpula lacrymans var. lacrymans S7.9]EGO26571.1 hypothetical protein SERLADRAFT_407308 [Serpula lacrymans var. lacrymans S7.9]
MQGNTQDDLNPDPEMQAGSSHHPHSLHFNLDDNDDDDERVVEQNENAGKVIRVDLDAHNKWRESFHQFHQDNNEMDVDLPDNRWAPFSTELDWKFAHWALQEGIGQKSLDRLLAIPEALLPQGASVAPVIIATDKTQLTQFSGDKSAYPVYLTLGNIPSSIRRKPSQHACVLIGYLSVNKMVKKGLTTKEKTARVQRLFHASVRMILEPLIEAGHKGMEVTAMSGDLLKVWNMSQVQVSSNRP